jgi:hypothetical protein
MVLRRIASRLEGLKAVDGRCIFLIVVSLPINVFSPAYALAPQQFRRGGVSLFRPQHGHSPRYLKCSGDAGRKAKRQGRLRHRQHGFPT